MERMICLDGTPVRLLADRVEVDLGAAGLAPADHHHDPGEACCGHGQTWQAVMSYDDGTTVYLHPPAFEGGVPGYRVNCPRPHRWKITYVEFGGSRTAKLGWEAV